MISLLDFQNFIEAMRATSSSNEKVQIIKDANPFIHKVLEYTYNPYRQYYVTSKTCRKNITLVEQHDLNLFEVLDKLHGRVVTGHEAIKLVNGYPLTEMLYKIIDKDLGIRAGEKVINKAIPGLIPSFSVALAQEYKGDCDWNDEWYASRKLDGVRCLAIVNEEGKCTLYSRMGKEITTLDVVKKAIEATNVINTVFDGEVCLLDEQGNEDFQAVMKQLRRKDHQIENAVYMIFDMLNKSEFELTVESQPLEDRLHTLRSWLGDDKTDNNILKYTQQNLLNDDEHFATWTKLAADNNWEGFMVRKNVAYEGKRSKNLLKVKKFYDAEYEVLDYDIDNHEVVRDGKSETIKMLSQVWIEHKGHKVKVGSGWTQDQRLKYMDGSIVGKIITVQYFEETKNQDGGISLRFPTVKVVHGDQREV